ncbi:MAG: DUF4375 domain-containing protein, partial [Acidobacteria bacterium]|nr:DUF4375 domain-containing protein [Acidobacteriota bacterium]
VERALRALSSTPLPASQTVREELIDSAPDEVKDKLEELDQAFFAYPDDLTALLFAYVATYPEAFGPVPTMGDA